MLFKSLFYDFKINKKEKLQSSEVGRIPEDWNLKKLEDVTFITDCQHSKKPKNREKENYLLQVYNIGEKGQLDLTDPYFISNEDYQHWIRRIEVKKGDIIISKTGRVGAIAQIPDMKAAIGRNLVCIRPNSEFLSPEYLKEYMLSNKMNNEIRLKTSSGTILDSLHVKYIKKLRIILPSESLLKKFS
ncbi:MAG: restriction endonuclease subunit S [Promethearchaeota archaeon]|nr:MAG: restriction endonuclease subunit S [Candidatus Lokiarchaeota archaeon]